MADKEELDQEETQDETLDQTSANEQDTEAESPPQTQTSGNGSAEVQSESIRSPSTTKSPSTTQSLSDSTQESQSITDVCAAFLVSIYKTAYYRKIVKSVLVFMLALKMAQESKMMVIPLKEYQPFTKH